MTEKQTIRFAVVGCGHIGMRHVAMIHQNPFCELVAVADVKAIGMDKEGLYGVKYFASLDELLGDNISKAVDVICIAVPNGLHAPMALQSLEAGKHIVLEKPMTLSKAEAERILHKSLEQQKHVFVVKQNRYSPPSA